MHCGHLSRLNGGVIINLASNYLVETPSPTLSAKCGNNTNLHVSWPTCVFRRKHVHVYVHVCDFYLFHYLWTLLFFNFYCYISFIDIFGFWTKRIILILHHNSTLNHLRSMFNINFLLMNEDLKNWTVLELKSSIYDNMNDDTMQIAIAKDSNLKFRMHDLESVKLQNRCFDC